MQRRRLQCGPSNAMLANNSAGWCSRVYGKVQRFVEKRITFKSDLFRESQWWLPITANRSRKIHFCVFRPRGTMALVDRGEINREGHAAQEQPHVDLAKPHRTAHAEIHRPVCVYCWCAKWESGRKTALFHQVKSGERITPLGKRTIFFCEWSSNSTVFQREN